MSEIYFLQLKDIQVIQFIDQQKVAKKVAACSNYFFYTR